LKEEIIIITNNSNKKMILREISKNKLLLNIKFLTFNDLKKKLYFDYDYKTIEYIINKYNVKASIALMYLENMYFLKDINNKKICFLNELKKDLEDNKLLIIDKEFKNYIKNKKIVVYGFYKLKKEEEMLLKEFSNVHYHKKDNRNFKPIVFEAKSLVEEVEFVAIKISELLEKAVLINNIKIIISEDYKNTVKRIFDMYNIPVNIKFNNSFYSTLIAKDFLANYNQLTLEENIQELSEKYDNVNDLIGIINKSVLVKDKTIRKSLIISDLKNTMIEDKIFNNAVECSNLNDEFNDDTYVFLMGFNINFYPKMVKDDDYLSDEVKSLLGLDISIEENNTNKENIKYQISNIKNLVISYKKESSKGVFYPSTIIKELELDVKEIIIDRHKSYSKLNSKILYAANLDRLYKFNMISEELGLYRNNLKIPYLEYDNGYTGINNDSLKKRLNNELNLAYTSVEAYNECAFKYYISKILKIDSFENTFKTIIGNVMHHILEIGIEKDINIELEIMQFVKEKKYVLNKKEFFYLEKLAKELKEVIDVIKMQNNHSKLNNYLFESNLYIYKDVDDIKVTFKGQFDKVMYNNFLDKEVLAVVDYKTGDTVITLDNLKYGLNMQLPIYLYLLKKSDRFKNAEIAGFYIQKVLDKVYRLLDNKAISDIRRDNMRLQGFTNSNANLIELLDNNYMENKILKNLKYKKNGELDSRSKVLSSKEMDELTNIVEEKINFVIKNIIDGEFKINPKVIKGKNIACTYCKFKDICYSSKKDEVVLGGEEDEMDGGTARSD